MKADKLAEIKARHEWIEGNIIELDPVQGEQAHQDRAWLTAYVETLTNQLNASQLLAKAASDELEKVTKERNEARKAACDMRYRLGFRIYGNSENAQYWINEWKRKDATLPWEKP